MYHSVANAVSGQWFLQMDTLTSGATMKPALEICHYQV